MRVLRQVSSCRQRETSLTKSSCTITNKRLWTTTRLPQISLLGTTLVLQATSLKDCQRQGGLQALDASLKGASKLRRLSPNLFYWNYRRKGSVLSYTPDARSIEQVTHKVKSTNITATFVVCRCQSVLGASLCNKTWTTWLDIDFAVLEVHWWQNWQRATRRHGDYRWTQRAECPACVFLAAIV